MGADYIEHQDKHGKTRAISLSVEAVERLNERAGRYESPRSQRSSTAGAVSWIYSKDSTFPGKS